MNDEQTIPMTSVELVMLQTGERIQGCCHRVTQEQSHEREPRVWVDSFQQIAKERLSTIIMLESRLREITRNYRVLFGHEPDYENMRRAAEVIEAAIVVQNLKAGLGPSGGWFDAIDHLCKSAAAIERGES